jgi:DNA polymerase III alpha subunit (gram-positive type)
MSDRLIQSQKRLHDSLFELYMQGGLELAVQGTYGLNRDLIIRLETSALTPEKGEIIHYYAVNRWDEEDEFDEFAKPSVALSAEAEAIICVTNAQLVHCRASAMVMGDFVNFCEAKLLNSSV